MTDVLDMGAAERKHRRRATGVLDPPAGYDPSDLVEYSEVAGSSGTGWPDLPPAGPGVRPSTRRRFVVWGVGLLVLLATIWIVNVISQPAGPPRALLWVLMPVVIAWVAAPAVYLTVLPAVEMALGTRMRPCVHCGLSIGGKDEWCRFCRAIQEPDPAST